MFDSVNKGWLKLEEQYNALLADRSLYFWGTRGKDKCTVHK